MERLTNEQVIEKLKDVIVEAPVDWLIDADYEFENQERLSHEREQSVKKLREGRRSKISVK